MNEHGEEEGLCLISQLFHLIICEPVKCCILDVLLHPGFPRMLNLWKSVNASLGRPAMVIVVLICSAPVRAAKGGRVRLIVAPLIATA